MYKNQHYFHTSDLHSPLQIHFLWTPGLSDSHCHCHSENQRKQAPLSLLYSLEGVNLSMSISNKVIFSQESLELSGSYVNGRGKSQQTFLSSMNSNDSLKWAILMAHLPPNTVTSSMAKVCNISNVHFWLYGSSLEFASLLESGMRDCLLADANGLLSQYFLFLG